MTFAKTKSEKFRLTRKGITRHHAEPRNSPGIRGGRTVDLLTDLDVDKKYYAISFSKYPPDADNIGGELRLKKLGPFELATAESSTGASTSSSSSALSFVFEQSKCLAMDLGLGRQVGRQPIRYAPEYSSHVSEELRTEATHQFLIC